MSDPQPLDETLFDFDHWRLFPEFIRYKLAVGEPSPHMKIVGYLSRDEDRLEQVWRAGCYAAPYSILTAEVLWTNWPMERMVKEPEKLLPWLREHWPGIHTRTERRCVRTPEKMAVCLIQYAEWARLEFPGIVKQQYGSNEEKYEAYWTSATSVKYMGRYIVIRLIELLRRYTIPEAPTLFDIRSIGAWSPKRTLAYLYPYYSQSILSNDSATSNRYTDILAQETLVKLQEEIPELDHYVFAAMLCEYREAFEDRHQYPGRTHDQEIEYHRKVSGYWKDYGFKSSMFEARAALFPHECLGEKNGWDGMRHELSRVVRDHNYN